MIQKGKLKALAAAAVMCVSAIGGAMPENVAFEAEAASFSYPVQEFRMGIGNTDRNISAKDNSSGTQLNSSTVTGDDNEKWYLNYVSEGVYEIVSSLTGEIVTEKNGKAVLSPDVDGAGQRWKIEGVDKDFDGYYLYYKITSNADSDKALTFNPVGNTVTLDTYSGANYQKYKLNLDGIEGFAANCTVNEGEKAGTIGGLLGKTVTASTADQLVEYLDSEEPLTVVITANIDMQSKSHTRLRNNKTLVGSYAANTITDSQFRTNDVWGTEGDEPSDDMVFKNIDFQAVNVPDRILVNIWSSRQIWIDHCSFTSKLNYDRTGNGLDEVGKFIWINTPYESYHDAKDMDRSPDYVTISYCKFNNRYWTVAYGTQNGEITRCRTTLCYNKWDKNVRRCPQIGNGSGHIYNNYFEGYDSGNGSGTAQIIAGDGSDMISENCRFQSFETINRCITAGGGAQPYRESGSYYAASSTATPTKVSFSPKVTSSWYPNKSNYGYSLVSAYNTNGTDTKDFCNAYAGCFDADSKLKYITDSDMSKFVETKYESPFLKSVEVSDAKPGAVMNTDVTYVFENAASGYNLEVAGGVAANGTDVVQGKSGAAGWTLTDAGDGYYKIYSEAGDGKTFLLDLDYGKPDNGTNIGIWGNTDSDAQSFKFVDNGDGTFTIVTKATQDASAIGIAAASKEEGASAIQWSCDGTDNQKWIAKVRMSGTLMGEILVDYSAYLDGWNVKSGVAAGDAVFTDRDVTYTSLPEELNDAEVLLNDCDAKNVATDLAEITAKEDISLYVGIDSRVVELPSWLSQWTATGLSAVNSKDVTFNLYKTELKAGENAVLGMNGQSSGCVNYTVFAVKKAAETTTTTTTATITTTTTTTIETLTTVTPDIIYGDANANGDVEVADAVFILQGIADPGNEAFALSDEGKKQADADGNGSVDAQDALAIQQFKAGIVEKLPLN